MYRSKDFLLSLLKFYIFSLSRSEPLRIWKINLLLHLFYIYWLRQMLYNQQFHITLVSFYINFFKFHFVLFFCFHLSTDRNAFIDKMCKIHHVRNGVLQDLTSQMGKAPHGSQRVQYNNTNNNTIEFSLQDYPHLAKTFKKREIQHKNRPLTRNWVCLLGLLELTKQTAAFLENYCWVGFHPVMDKSILLAFHIAHDKTSQTSSSSFSKSQTSFLIPLSIYGLSESSSNPLTTGCQQKDSPTRYGQWFQLFSYKQHMLSHQDLSFAQVLFRTQSFITSSPIPEIFNFHNFCHSCLLPPASNPSPISCPLLFLSPFDTLS